MIERGAYMSKMSELHRVCVEMAVMVEDGSIDMDEAIEMIMESYPEMSLETATMFLSDVFECY